MRFPRQARVFHGQLDASPFVGVLFLLVLIVLLNSSLVFTPGIPIHLPEAAGFAGTTNATVTVSIDGRGQFYYLSQLVQERELAERFREAVRRDRSPVTLVLIADENVPNKTLVRLVTRARDAGIFDTRLAVAPPGPRTGGGAAP